MAETVSLTIPESGEITTAAQSARACAQSFVIQDAQSYDDALTYREEALDRIKQGEALFKDATVQANAVHKRLVGLLKAATEPWQNIAAIYRRKMIAWDEEQKAIQRRKQAEEDAKAKAEAEQKQRELADTMRELGLEQQAAEVEREPPIVQAPIVPRETEQAIKYRSNWTFEIECLSCGAERGGPIWVKYGNMNLHEGHEMETSAIPREYMTPDYVKIGKMVRALKGETKIPGIRPCEEKV